MTAMTKSVAQQTLTPELKDWLDRVIVPALVDAYLVEKEVANGDELAQNTVKLVTSGVVE